MTQEVSKVCFIQNDDLAIYESFFESIFFPTLVFSNMSQILVFSLKTLEVGIKSIWCRTLRDIDEVLRGSIFVSEAGFIEIGEYAIAVLYCFRIFCSNGRFSSALSARCMFLIHSECFQTTTVIQNSPQ